MARYEVGTKVYYTGDMANSDGHFTVAAHRVTDFGLFYDLEEIDGERKFLGVHHIADRYEGHCGDRFVTERAWLEYREGRIEEMRRMAERAAYLRHQRALQS